MPDARRACSQSRMLRFACPAAVAASLLLSLPAVLAQKSGKVPGYYGPQPPVETLDLTMYARIRGEAFSMAMRCSLPRR